MTKSAVTQFEQSETIMGEMKMKAKFDFTAKPTWTTSPDSRELTTMGESFRQEVNGQKNNYHKRISPESEYCIELRRKHQKGIYCSECKNSEIHGECTQCGLASPIPIWIRKRTVTFHTTTDANWMTVTCSCHHNDSYPCRHIASLVEARWWHFIPRYHRKFIHAFETKEGMTFTEYYKPKLTNTCFYVLFTEWRKIVNDLSNDASLVRTRLAEQVWDIEETQVMQRTETGLVAHRVLQGIGTPVPKFSQVGMSQEFGVPEPSPWQTQTPMRDTGPQILQTGNFYLDNNSMLAQVSQQCRQNKELERKVSSMFRDFWPQVMQEINKYYPANESGADNSEFLDLYGNYDTRKKDIRLKAGYERTKKRKAKDIAKAGQI